MTSISNSFNSKQLFRGENCTSNTKYKNISMEIRNAINLLKKEALQYL